MVLTHLKDVEIIYKYTNRYIRLFNCCVTDRQRECVRNLECVFDREYIGAPREGSEEMREIHFEVTQT